MNRTEMVDSIAKENKMPKATVDSVLKSFENTVVKNVKKGDKVVMTGFLTFDKKKRSARNGVNPATGEKIKIKAKTVPSVKCGSSFKSAVEGKRKK